jgi:putative Holliday junction resolvase
MGRILAFDYGTKRTGIAKTDPLQIIATALETVPTHTALDYIEKYLSQEDVEAFVVGEPKQMDGSFSESYKFVKSFAKQLRKRFPHIPVHWTDERFTSKMAKETLILSGVPKQKRKDKGLLDSTAAVIILQTYLQSI